MSIQLTDQQQAAVDNRGGELLVSAAAGSGKTRVLVERLLDRVEQEGLDVDQFLIITSQKLPPPSCGARSCRASISALPSIRGTGTSDASWSWSIRLRSPPSMPCVPPF